MRTIEQERRTCDEYVQEFKKVVRGSGYERWPLIEEFKRGLSKVLRRKLAEAENSPSTIEESNKARQKPETEQRKEKSVGEECNAPTEKCVAQGRL